MVKRIMLLTFVIITSAFLAACGNGGFKADHNWKVQDFSYTNQNNETVSLEDLKGKVWLAAFIFTNCDTVCPPMTYNMTLLQEELQEKGIEDYQIVSFSVDPEVDTPEALSEYISKYDADTSKWDLVTGYSQDHISKFAEKSFKSLVADDPNSDQVVHQTSFYLVNQEGRTVKSYSGYEDVPFDQIALDMEALIKEGK
ncbi:SCO family protein [Rossellomorea vietnamensis]|uniref:SCO family protein n=1 Tax=Rossellomorea vietnamensis TaxID=218284 RepID=A0A5D4MF08_9BACI|nr:SCO family protein [Rossellomorea vietnamensis]TYS00283.1 SCO family protein [Rossellomorea vietnamensis]